MLAGARDARERLRSPLPPGALADPYPVYARLRREDPVHWSERLQVWIVTRYADVVAALRDPRLSSDRIELFATHQLRGLDLRRFDITRTSNGHHAFGVGPHICLGAHLARCELHVAFAQLQRRLPRMRFSGRPERRYESLMFRGFRSIPVEL
jgi:cytochrome P450